MRVNDAGRAILIASAVTVLAATLLAWGELADQLQPWVHAAVFPPLAGFAATAVLLAGAGVLWLRDGATLRSVLPAQKRCGECDMPRESGVHFCLHCGTSRDDGRAADS